MMRQQAPLTRRQAEVLLAIVRRQHAQGYAPSVRELADDLGIGSPNGVHVHLRRLRDLGAVEWTPGVARSLRLKRGA